MHAIIPVRTQQCPIQAVHSAAQRELRSSCDSAQGRGSKRRTSRHPVGLARPSFPRSGRENGGDAQHLRGKQHAPRAHWSSEGRARPMQRRGDEGICCSAALLSASPSSISAGFQLNRDPGSACRPQGLPLHGQHDVHLACLLRMVRSLSRFPPLSLRRNSPRRACSPASVRGRAPSRIPSTQRMVLGFRRD